MTTEGALISLAVDCAQQLDTLKQHHHVHAQHRLQRLAWSKVNFRNDIAAVIPGSGHPSA